MKQKIVKSILLVCLALSLALPVSAANGQRAAADRLYALGLFNGVSNNADGTPDYALERSMTRQEAVTMLVRLLGAEEEAKKGSWYLPFTDVDDWARPYVGYAYATGLTNGLSATTFGGTQPVTATQYITFVLRAMGYASEIHFAWDAAWKFTDMMGITAGQYHDGNNRDFLRGDAVLVSAAALDAMIADGSGRTLLALLEERGAVTDRPLEPVDRPEGGYRPEIDEQASLSNAIRQFVRDIVREGTANGEVDWADQPHLMRETKGWYSYYGDAFGSEEDALLSAFCNYLRECLDGDYERVKDAEYYRRLDKEQYMDGYDPLWSPSRNSDIYSFIHADTDGMITAYGIYHKGDPNRYRVTFCRVDSSQLAKRLHAAYLAAGEGLAQVSCQVTRQENMAQYTFGDIPENAAWMCLPANFSGIPIEADDVPRIVRHGWERLLSGTTDLVPVQSIYSDKVYESKVKYQICLFLDADYTPIAYAVAAIPAN